MPFQSLSGWGCALMTAVFLAARTSGAQSPAPVADTPPPATLTVRSSLVLVPALVKTKGGELVFSLNADDFVLTDDGVPQRLRLEADTDAQPLALVVLVQTGGSAEAHLHEYRGLDAVLDAVVGTVQHRVAVVSFDSAPHLEQPFTTKNETAAAALNELDAGDPGVAILDGVRFAVDLLRKQPPAYRRAILMLSETVDQGSQTSLEDALRAIEDTNTSIYSFGFSSTKAALKHEGAKVPIPFGTTKYSSKPYAAGGCMSREPDADPDAHGKRKVQALDCAEDLLPPLRIARMAFLAAREGLQRNVPETVARLTGGEYFPFKDARSLSRSLVTISNDVPNHYVLSFVPQSPHAGLHALELGLKGRPELELKARAAYWVDGP